MSKKLIGVSGSKGSFSEAAAQYYIEQNKINADIIYLLDMEAVLNHLSRRKIDLGIFPVVNNNAGLVMQAFKPMGHYEFNLIGQLDLPINHCLLSLAEVRREEITEIVSHPQALAQCKDNLKKLYPKAVLRPWVDTAEAAKNLQEAVLSRTVAVIAPQASANLYNLKIQHEQLQDKDPNITSFIVVENRINELNNIEELRKEICEIDKKLICLLADRNALSKKIGKYKKDHQLPTTDASRENELRQFHQLIANQNGLDLNYSASIFSIILEESKRVQKS